MPVYLCHGFRWHRKSIRYFVVLKDVDDAAPEWIVAPRSAAAILETFYGLYDFLPLCVPPRYGSPFRRHAYSASNSSNPSSKHSSPDRRRGTESDSRASSRLSQQIVRNDTSPLPPNPPPSPPADTVVFNDWSPVKMLEEFDPSNEDMVSGPWAYLSDYVVKVDTSVCIAEEIARYELVAKQQKQKAMSGPSDETGRTPDTFNKPEAGWFEKLRDRLQKGEQVRWYVVVCGDEEREADDGDSGSEYEDESEGEEEEDRREVEVEPSCTTLVEGSGPLNSRPPSPGEDDFKPPLASIIEEKAKARPQRIKSGDTIPPPVPEKDYPPTPPKEKPQRLAPPPPRQNVPISRVGTAPHPHPRQNVRSSAPRPGQRRSGGYARHNSTTRPPPGHARSGPRPMAAPPRGGLFREKAVFSIVDVKARQKTAKPGGGLRNIFSRRNPGPLGP